MAGLQYDLVWASFNGEIDRVTEALERSPESVNGTDEEGSTPLIAASWGGHLEVVQLLLARGADIEAVNSTHGWNALMSAASRGHTPVVEYLLQKRANALVLDKHDADALSYARQNRHTAAADLIEAAVKRQSAVVRVARERRGFHGDAQALSGPLELHRLVHHSVGAAGAICMPAHSEGATILLLDSAAAYVACNAASAASRLEQGDMAHRGAYLVSLCQCLLSVRVPRVDRPV